MNVRHRSMHSLVCTSGAMAAVLLAGAVSTASAAASLTPLGDLPGYTTSVVTGVSGDGSVIVGYSYGSVIVGSGYEAFRWTSGGGMVGLGLLPGGLFSSQAEGVSADGSVVVGWSNSDSGRQAFRWTAAGGMQGLGDLPGGSFDSWARGVSADGSMIVGSSVSASENEAFRWTSGGGMVGLGNLPGEDASVARAVSGDGSTVVGWSVIVSDFRYQAFRWTSDGGMVGLGDLPGGSFDSAALGVSGDGSVIVGYGVSDSGRQPIRWTSDGGMMGLGSLHGGFNSFGAAVGVSDDGSIVVGSIELGPSSVGAFYWTADGGMRKMWDLLLSHGVDPAADGWTELTAATDISADGSTIIGSGIRNDNHEAFVAVIPIVPEPAAGALALLGVSSILLLRRHCVWRPNKLKVLHFHALAGALTLIAAAPAAAIDTEPLNNSQLTADSLPTLLPGTQHFHE
jgi:probable HAF family extracellular repeat protein